MMEEWRPVVGFEGWYEVSDQGRVRSLDRSFTDCLRRSRVMRGKLLSGSSAAGKYRMVILYRAGERSAQYVHDIVARAFIGQKPAGAVTRHLDDRPSNNAVVNLAYGSQADNMADADANGLWPFSEAHHHCKFPACKITALREDKHRMSSTAAGAKHGISARYIREIWAGEKRTRG